MAGDRFAAALIAALALFVPSAGALEVVSAVPVRTENGKRADFVLAGSVTVRGISFEKGAVKMPVSEYKDRTYTDIKILSKALYKKIEACFFKERCEAGGRVAPPKVLLLGVTPLKSPVRIANVSLSFDGDLAVTFGAVKRNSGEMWTSYPDNFEVTDASLRNLIDAEVSEAVKALSRDPGTDARPAASED